MAGLPLAPQADASGDGAQAAREEVRRTVAALSAAWQGRDYDALAQFFAKHVVFAFPGFSARLQGAHAVIESYREFMDRVTLTAYREDAAMIDVWGDTAVVTYRWEMAWLAGGVPNHEAGHDVFVLQRPAAGAPWRAVWRTMTFMPPTGRPPAPAA